jgi:mRNA interferase RelE/StbE
MPKSRKSSGWTLEYSKAAERLLKKMPKPVQRTIVLGMEEIVIKNQDPTAEGKPLQGSKRGHWRYRFGDYRVICRIDHDVVKVLVLHLGHRGDVYR